MKILLCPPKYYQIEYEINPWMDVNNKIDSQKAAEEFENLVGTFKKIGLEVVYLEPQKGLPDMVYAANFGFVMDGTFIKSNFKFAQRKKEADIASEYFRNNKFKINEIPENIFFEGQGDLIYRDGKFFAGYGKRTAREAINYLEEIIGESIITFEVNNPYFYHLDTCFAPLGKGCVVINPESFSRQDNEKIKKNFRKVIFTSKEDNRLLCCNLVATDSTVVLGEGISHDLKKELWQVGYETIEVPMGEFLKGGGSVKCLTLEFYES